MSVRLYFDVNIRRAVADGLRLRGIDVLRAQDDGADELEDPELLDCAGELERLLFTQDKDLLREASRRQRAVENFAGVIYAQQREISVGKCVTDLEIIAKDSEPDEWIGRVEHLPL